MAGNKQVLVNLDFLSTTRGVNVPDPIAALDMANKQYIDALVSSVTAGISWKESVRAASTADVAVATPGANLDTIALALGDRVLLKDQTAQNENGIYVFDTASTPLVRTTDADLFDELEAAVVTVEEGTQGGTIWRQTEVNGTVGVDNILWVAFASVVAAATETVAGIAEIATQVETDAGVLDDKIVTPLKLATSPFAKRKVTADVGDGVLTVIPVVHNFGTRDVQVEVYDNSGNFDTVEVRVDRPDVNTVNICFASAPTSAEYRVVVIA